MHTGLIVIAIALVALAVSKFLSRQLKAYGSGQSSSLGVLQGRYALGFLVMVAISAAAGGAITFLLEKGTTLFLGLTGAFSLFGLPMLFVGSRRTRLRLFDRKSSR
jgi:hypothetical protein